MDEFSIDIKNMDHVLEGFEHMKERMRSESVRFVARTTQMMYDVVRVYAGLTDHSLADLAKLGHPYARRFAPNTLHPDWLVHVQKGTLQAGIQQLLREGEGWASGIIHNPTYYDYWVQRGTRFMRPRPYMNQARLDMTPIVMEAAVHLGQDIVVSVRGG